LLSLDKSKQPSPQHDWLPVQAAPPALPGQVHRLAEHCSPMWQGCPQPPQFCVSLVVSVQAPVQHEFPVGQAGLPAPQWQTLASQVSPGLQDWPQPEQLAGSFVRFLQPLEQQVSLPVQMSPLQVHLPLEQVSVPVQVTPHMPQLLLSRSVSTHMLPPQQVLGALHALPPHGQVPSAEQLPSGQQSGVTPVH
jgi:hypothetical protein